VERFLVSHRASLTLFVAYCSFFWRLYDDVGKLGTVAPGAVPTPLSGAALLDGSVVEPLTRAGVLSQSRLVAPDASGHARVRAGLRREKKDQLSPEEARRQEEMDDPIRQLENALRLIATSSDPVHRSRLSSEAYMALGRLHSAHGRYYEMLHAVTLALRASADVDGGEAVPDLHVAFGHLELKHHRYYAAGTRFEDALRLGSNGQFQNFTRIEALAGLGWAALMQANLAAAVAHFSEALGGSSAINAVTSRAYGCRAQLDGLDGARALSLAGLAVASSAPAQGMRTADLTKRSSSDLIDCAASLFQSVPRTLQESHVWHGLGLARYVAVESSACSASQQAVAQRYHWQAVNQAVCDSAEDLPSCSHSVLHLGLLDFNRGNASVAMARIESLLNRSGEVELEAAEWLIRFARAHAWTPSGSDFAASLFGRAEPLLSSEGDARRARHLADHGRLLLQSRDQPSASKEAVVQLSRARAIVESRGADWPEAEVAALYSSLGTAQRHIGKISEAVDSFEAALAHRRLATVEGDISSQKLLLIAYTNLAAARIEIAGLQPDRWHAALKNLQDGRRLVRKAGLSPDDPVVETFEASFRNARLLAHRRGVLATCPGPLDALLYGLQSPRDSNCLH
jgi:tetratricopeptide (TPR) repeat protein